MTKPRTISKAFRSKPVTEGAGVRLKRAFGFSELPLFDPFLLLDDFRSGDSEDYRKGFPWHPHRGIETITYMLEGQVEHGDSLGNSGVIRPGGLQWMTAGSGIIHQEMPEGDRHKRMGGLQLWANLPASQKMTRPRYRDITDSQVPKLKLDSGVTISLFSGRISETVGPVDDIAIDPEYLDVTVPPSTSFTHPVKRGHTVLAYVIGGRGIFCHADEPFSHDTEGVNYFDMEPAPYQDNEILILFSDGDSVTISTENDSVRFLLISGKPLNEPVAWYGPIVMNTREELRTAFEEYQNGTFIKER
ncbi:pirin family protein [Chlorobaculum sp. MV4-Y]|uniref:pirin family protein n=1 Tax=Chlorobaculum sp. MV4-Y TaxID=2976335 RepID=UPI0021AEEFCE|nr:pirin family protein [Chlorobaculum sp. MV4-Y]UWX57986.1 pirin family protein [Chlorobaculum sp. MV4-Y]